MEPESEAEPAKTPTKRHKCAACFKQYKKKDHLIVHMKTSYHSVHQPKCEVCKRHCKSFESLREHLTGPLRKVHCSTIFSANGCDLCMKIFDSPDAASEHKEACRLPPPVAIATLLSHSPGPQNNMSSSTDSRDSKAIAMDCEMVGGGTDGSIDICARVCLIDEEENLVFHAYIRPVIPVTNYRHEVTGLTEEHLQVAIQLEEVQAKIKEILYNGEAVGRLRLNSNKARLLVGHDLEHDLKSLRFSYPDHLLRDTAKYHPLMKTNLVSHSLKYLTQTYLGHTIQAGIHDPYEDAISAMRLYKRMRAQLHKLQGHAFNDTNNHTPSFISVFELKKHRELEKMSPEELLELSRPNYRCWCLDSMTTIQEESANNPWGSW
ncbi:unnamed protein product [Rhodiola kirilowii]